MVGERYLIVNADDFGASAGVNRGIIEAHAHGIVTSASLMVDMPGARDAAEAMRDLPTLSVGLHAVLTTESAELVIDPAHCAEELARQFERFQELAGRPPTHLDSHHNIHRDSRLTGCFLELAARHGLPMREHSGIGYHADFYGQWDGETHLEQLSVENLKQVLDGLPSGVTDLGCHPGYVDAGFSSSYSIERETEVSTLCDPSVRAHLEQAGIRLISFAELPPGFGPPSSPH
jgi:predicted glycoside hydrolase/deacetylase ChbG (UPF0249 family)